MPNNLHLELTRLISESGLTHRQIAAKMGIHHPQLTRMLRDGYNPTINSLEALAAALGYKLEVRFIKEE
jgi:transcriptional regulator with XRE-family HTH domain